MSYINVIECPECGSDKIAMGEDKPGGKKGISRFKYSQEFTCNGCGKTFEINYNINEK